MIKMNARFIRRHTSLFQLMIVFWLLKITDQSMTMSISSTFYFVFHHVVNLSVFLNYLSIKFSMINCFDDDDDLSNKSFFSTRRNNWWRRVSRTFDFVALISSFICWSFVIILRKILCSSLRLALKNWSLSTNDFHDDCESDLIMIHVNNVFETSLRFINVEEILKRSLLAIDDLSAKWHIINKVSYFEIQQFAEKNKWHCSQIQRKNLNNDDSTYQAQLINLWTFRSESIIRTCWILWLFHLHFISWTLLH